MREIKFRAYIGDGVWCYAELKGEKFDTRIFPLREGAVLNPKVGTWQQYTGLKDKNGKEIYEGDVVKYLSLSGFEAEDSLSDKELEKEGKERIGEVKFSGGEFRPRETGSYPEDGYYGWRDYAFEVIGNIFENPELLTA